MKATTAFFLALTSLVALGSSDALGQWTQTSFSDSIGIHVLLTIGRKIFVGCGGPIAVPVGREKKYTLTGRSLPYAVQQEFGPGVYTSEDSGASWGSAGLSDTTVIALTSIGTELIASTLSTGVFRSTDFGKSWLRADSGLGAALVLTFAVGSGRTGGENIYAGTFGEGFYVSHDGGVSWIQVNNVLNSSSSIVTFLTADAGTLFASTWMGSLPVYGAKNGLYKSTDFGTTWTVPDTEFANLPHVECVAVDGDNVMAGMSTGLYRSVDGGITWSREDSTDDFISILHIGSEILAGTNRGVYLSSDNGSAWKAVDSGIGDTSAVGMLGVSASEVVSVSGVSYQGLPEPFAGHNGGVWVRPISQLTGVKEKPVPLPVGFSLSQNFPNPFNPTTTIEYGLPAEALVTLKVYDVLGREIRSLVDRRQAAGEHFVTFDGSSLPSGIYFCRVQAGKYTAVKKMTVIR